MERQKKKTIVAFLIIFVVVVVVNYLKLTNYLTLSYLHSNMNLLHELIKKQYIFSVCCYLFSFMLTTALSIPGSSIFTTAGGLLFGWAGLLYALLAATLGATILFLASRYFFGTWIQQKYAKQLVGFNNEINEYGHYYLLIIRLIAVVPFCLVNMLSGLTLLSLSTFISMTVCGLIPVSTVYVFAGKQLSKLATPDDFFSPSVMLAFSVFIVFKVALAPAIFKIAKRLIKLVIKKKNTQSSNRETIPHFVISKKQVYQKQI